MAKYKVGLHNYEPVGLYNLDADLNRLKDDILYEDLLENAITVVKNTNDLVPLTRLETKTLAYVALGDDDGTPFYNELKKYTKIHKIEANQLDVLINKLQSYNTVIVGFHRSNENPWKSHKFSNKELVWLYEIAQTHDVILNVFVKPYALDDLKTIENIESIIVATKTVQ